MIDGGTGSLDQRQSNGSDGDVRGRDVDAHVSIDSVHVINTLRKSSLVLANEAAQAHSVSPAALADNVAATSPVIEVEHDYTN
jgi:hypothetical protein